MLKRGDVIIKHRKYIIVFGLILLAVLSARVFKLYLGQGLAGRYHNSPEPVLMDKSAIRPDDGDTFSTRI